MTTYLFIGLVVVLIGYLVRGRRSRPAPAPAPERAHQPPPAPAAPPPVERAPAVAPRPAGDIGSEPPGWAIEETIAEPGWPMPGEIAGAWSNVAASPSAPPGVEGGGLPAAVVEWAPIDAPEAAEEPEPVAEEWTMPALDPAPADPEPAWMPAAGEDEPDPETTHSDVEEPSWMDPTPPLEPAWPNEPHVPEPAVAEVAATMWMPEAPVAELPAEPVWTEEAVHHLDDETPAAEPQPVHVPIPEPMPMPVETPPAAVITWPPDDAPAAPVIADATQVDGQAHEAARLLARIARPATLTRVCDRLGVTPRMLAVMKLLAEGPMSVTDQARRLGVSRPVVADLSARLESAGLVRRERVAADARRVLIALTDAGRSVCAEADDTPDLGRMERALMRLAPAERAGFLAALRALEDSP